MAAQESNSNVIDSCQSSEEDTALINTLPSAMFWDVMEIKKWQGFWFEPGLIKPAMKFCSYFQARNDDVLLASAPKTGLIKNLTRLKGRLRSSAQKFINTSRISKMC
ncbi:hypothetical protein FXO38_12335 [Capsicum annuum]|uniref:Uncharacterized protein n=1 Tax=Capsicum annuum TaxID=4072 RepID=A0A2G2ZXA4_CAPAN|nr:hypothetical protein FXO37_23025 [Capsicum annuum]KAF3660020.1 hypothetical protein FXO38_12335 [Capsicum annuum]PHT86599.1 hypothetical protein T459_08705 [Capsicum annuum]